MRYIYEILIVCWVLVACLAQDPEITERILPEIKRLGTTGNLSCTVINQMDNPVYWRHRATETTISSDDKIVIDEKLNVIVNGWPKYQVEATKRGGKNTYTIMINRLEARDAGTYSCLILVRGSDRHPSKDGELIVLSPPTMVRSVTSKTQIISIGQEANLTCDATGYPLPNITWVRVNGDLLPNNKMRHRNKTLRIPYVRRQDRGIYRCLADNNVRPPAMFDIVLVIAFRPEGKAVQSSYGQAQNRMFDVTIECRIAGYPEPDLQWYKVNQAGTWEPIRNDDKHTVNILLNHANMLGPNERWFQLVIRTVQANDYGNYICEGKNEHGSGYDTVNVYETSECQGPNCPPEHESGRGRASPKYAMTISTLCLTFVTFTVARVMQ